MKQEPISNTEKEKVLPKPKWLRVKAPTAKQFNETKELMRNLTLNTVCEEAACPNISECWSKKHATVMILGSTCTRSCRFCNISTGIPDKLDPHEPDNVGKAAGELGLNHIVITSVDRDDLEDGGANHFARTIAKIKLYAPGTTVEILTPDFRRKYDVLKIVVNAKPDVFNHNIETVPRLYNQIRPGARYFHSLNLLKHVKELDPKIFTKSGLMVGLGEDKEEVLQVMDDMRSADIDFITIGQYLRPTSKHAEVKRYVTPEEFDYYERMAKAKGFLMVSASPFTRSSYHAGDDFEQMKKNRLEQLKNTAK